MSDTHRVVLDVPEDVLASAELLLDMVDTQRLLGRMMYSTQELACARVLLSRIRGEVRRQSAVGRQSYEFHAEGQGRPFWTVGV